MERRGAGPLKPLVFAFVISLIGCFYGLRTTGGTQGVGRATTQAMVHGYGLIFILDLLITKIFVSQGEVDGRRTLSNLSFGSKKSPSRSTTRRRC